MSDSATFEFETILDLQTIACQISNLWKGDGYYADVYTHPGYRSNRFFCTLEYIYGYPNEEEMLRDAVNYLLEIASNQQVYYYRCSDFAPLPDEVQSIVRINLDNLFQTEFSPSLQASIERKYLIRYY
ncbi:hypothetical protein [Leptolyngbya sp. FACHB-711]|uniref:hypothetical protein n=1 Tax=unclassified Leptolyngbya TaxID=2650499 RepID=UPI0016862051|nr:hypothetical protein [Leptolyngbya sp. FACHB-711]MBD1850802.1 hypothetical protein [Cyanobacteria bacterium FACHB-502]MBD2023506.1 hypothetical protein [Leptolyngbya sp. FACHB-711]